MWIRSFNHTIFVKLNQIKWLQINGYKSENANINIWFRWVTALIRLFEKITAHSSWMCILIRVFIQLSQNSIKFRALQEDGSRAWTFSKWTNHLIALIQFPRHTWNFIQKYLCLRTIWPLKNFSNPIQVKLVSILYSITLACYWNIDFILVSDSIIEARKQKEAISSFQRPLLNHKHSLWLPVTTVWTEVMNVGSAIED